MYLHEADRLLTIFVQLVACRELELLICSQLRSSPASMCLSARAHCSSSSLPQPRPFLLRFHAVLSNVVWVESVLAFPTIPLHG